MATLATQRLATLAMLMACSWGSVFSVVLGAALLGLAYGATAPSSAHLLVPRTPLRMMNLVLSIRQMGAPRRKTRQSQHDSGRDFSQLRFLP